MGNARTFGVNFWREATERAFKTAAQALALLYAGDAANVLQVHYKTALATAAGGYILSVITSVATAGVGAPDSPSAVKRTLP